ncbi:hypothetical protein D3C79_561130 [compost metagenome]
MQLQVRLRLKHLHGQAVDFLETRSEDVMALDNLLQCCLQGIGRQFTLQRQGARHVIGRTLWRELLHKPQTLLGERQRLWLLVGVGCDGVRGTCLVGHEQGQQVVFGKGVLWVYHRSRRRRQRNCAFSERRRTTSRIYT